MKRCSALMLVCIFVFGLAACLQVEPKELDPVLVLDDFEADGLDLDLWKVVPGNHAENAATIVEVEEGKKLFLTGIGDGTVDVPRLDTKTAFSASTEFVLEVELDIPDEAEGGSSYTAIARIDPATTNRPEVWQLRFQNGKVRLAGHRASDNGWGIISSDLGSYQLGQSYKITVESKANGDAKFTVICIDTDEVIAESDWYSFGDQWAGRSIAFRLCLHLDTKDPARSAYFDNLSVTRPGLE